MKKMTNNCRFCKAPLSRIFVDLGMSPLSNSFLKPEMLNEKEAFYPLRVFVCEKCFLVQLSEFESPQNIFNDYAYFSSYSDSWLKHAENYVKMMMIKFQINEENLVIELASNDGYLLQYFKKSGIPILGIEPAANVAKVAESKGIPTMVKFFGVDTAKELVSKKKQPHLIVGNNVLAHVPNLNDFVKGMKILLNHNGIITMEFPHLLQLIKNNQFDTIYHEHFSYFSLLTVIKIFSSHGLTIFDVEEIPTHGGSLRIYVTHSKNNTFHMSKKVDELINSEKKFGLTNITTYTEFSKKVQEIKKNIREFFINAKKEEKKIFCYGAAAKGNTLLNYCSIGNDFVDCVLDLSPYKQGLFLPGTHIPIKNPDYIKKIKPNYLVILPWNLKEEIMEEMSFIREWRGKFVVLIPEVKILL